MALGVLPAMRPRMIQESKAKMSDLTSVQTVTLPSDRSDWLEAIPVP